MTHQVLTILPLAIFVTAIALTERNRRTATQTEAVLVPVRIRDQFPKP